MKKLKELGCMLVIFFNIQACQQDNITDLPAPPTVSFDVQTTSSPNYLLLVDQTPGTFLHKWDLGNGAKADSSVVEAYYPYAGTYTVTLQSFNAGGFGTATKEVTIGQDDPDACFGNIKLLTSCSTKTWVLEPAAGALKVGPDADFTTVWYQTGEADVAVRSCMFNDEYSFSIDGTFQYDNKGDFWADTDNSGNVTPADMGCAPGCQPSTAWPPQYNDWNSNINSFTVNETEITLNGSGVFLGLYKVANGMEVVTPQSNITYQIKELTEDKLIVLINFGPGFWQFTFVPK
ncbi:MAG: PKD domain-containing protein [Chitinophagaceae bacterium]|nr:PKD domain-containing protein [Chitinophagaceae bacterium]